MATARAAQNLAEFVKLQTVGAAIFGQIVAKGQNQNGDFITLSPAGYRRDADAKFTRYEELALGLSTDLVSKISDSDKGRLMLVVFVATKPTAKSPMKLYNVWEISAAEAGKLLAGEPMPAEWSAAPELDSSSSSVQDDLPF